MMTTARATAMGLAAIALCAVSSIGVISARADRAEAAAAYDRYAPASRVAYVQRAVQALVALGPARDELELALYQATRKRCGERPGAPPLACVLEVGRQLCAGKGPTCVAAVDVMLVNLRGSDELLDDATRLRLLRGGGEYHAAVLAALRQRYGALAAELVIEAPDASATAPVSPAAVDRFCAHRDDRKIPPRCAAPSATCVPSLSWQRCVAAISWFVTTATPAPPADPATTETP